MESHAHTGDRINRADRFHAGVFLSTVDTVTRLVRATTPGHAEVYWQPETGSIATPGLEGLDAVVHLAGEKHCCGTLDAAKKASIRDSRVQGTHLLCDALAQLVNPPKVLVSASAIGYYGDRGAEVLREDSRPGRDFLADVCRAWEAATAPAAQRGIRVVNVRFGMCCSPPGAPWRKCSYPSSWALVASSAQGSSMSWIALDDVVGAIHHTLITDTLHGPVNAVAPNPVTNAVFTKTLGQVLWRPTLFPLPAFVARAAFGEMADALLLASTRVEPARLRTPITPFAIQSSKARCGMCLAKPGQRSAPLASPIPDLHTQAALIQRRLRRQTTGLAIGNTAGTPGQNVGVQEIVKCHLGACKRLQGVLQRLGRGLAWGGGHPGEGVETFLTTGSGFLVVLHGVSSQGHEGEFWMRFIHEVLQAWRHHLINGRTLAKCRTPGGSCHSLAPGRIASPPGWSGTVG